MALKTVVITGCSEGGIGAALAESFAGASFRVFATARNPAKMACLEGKPNIELVTLDPTSADSVSDAFKHISKATGGVLDVLVNNAGQTLMAPTLDFDIEEAKEMYDINLWGALRVTQTFAPLVIAAKGMLVYTCSISSECRTPYLGVYAGSKGALAQIANTLRTELAPFGVKVLTVFTGAVATQTLAAGKDFKLPENSIYKQIEEKVAARARGEDGIGRTTPAEYASQVVKAVQSGTSASIWKGGFAGVARFMAGYLPVWVWDSLASKGCGLEDIKL